MPSRRVVSAPILSCSMLSTPCHRPLETEKLHQSNQSSLGVQAGRCHKALTPGTFTFTSVAGPGTGGVVTSTFTPPLPAGLTFTLVATWNGGPGGWLGGLQGAQWNSSCASSMRCLSSLISMRCANHAAAARQMLTLCKVASPLGSMTAGARTL